MKGILKRGGIVVARQDGELRLPSWVVRALWPACRWLGRGAPCQRDLSRSPWQCLCGL